MTVKSLDEAVGLWMIRCCGEDVDSEERVQFFPHRAGELGPSVHSDVGGDAKTSDPNAKESIAASGGLDVWERFPLSPPRKTIDNRKEVALASRLRERANQVEMERSKTTRR